MFQSQPANFESNDFPTLGQKANPTQQQSEPVASDNPFACNTSTPFSVGSGEFVP